MTDYIEHRKRLRERFRDGGPEALHDYEKLELLLTFAVPRVDVKPVAKALVKRFGGVNEALDASCEELESVKGLGAQSATLIRLVKALFVVYTEERADGRDVFSSPGEVLQFARVTLGGASHESFMVIFLDIKNQIIGHQIINEGTVDHAVVYPRRVVESALAHHASALILVHNHPSGDATPSADDKHLTRCIEQAAGALGIRVLDHVVVGKSSHFSFHENGLV